MADTTSFFANAHTEPQNPLALVQGYASASHTLAENKLLQQTIRGRAAIGKIIEKNTDDTGIVNPAGALRDISRDPDAAWMYTQQQEEMKNANPLTSYMGRNTSGQNVPAQAPLYKVPGIFPPANAGEEPPPLSQDKIDELHTHNQAMINTLEPLTQDPNIDHKKVIGAVSDLVANPDAKFTAHDGATALGQIPFGSNGQPPSSADIHDKLRPILEQQKQNEAILSQKYPSSQQLASRKAQPPSPTDLATPGAATGLPAGYSSPLSKSRENYDQVIDSAKNIPGTLSAYNEVINLNKQGALTGTRLADAYQIAARNDPLHILSGATEEGVKTQEIQKWLSQGLIQNGMPSSDARLQELQHGNLNADQLPETIKELAPFFKAVSEGAIKKQNFYNRVTNDGADLTHEPAALQQWNNNYDPRWIEFDELPSKASQKEFLVKHPDLIGKRGQHETLKKMGVIGNE